eukprot:401608-Prymnesium_polylepis.1
MQVRQDSAINSKPLPSVLDVPRSFHPPSARLLPAKRAYGPRLSIDDSVTDPLKRGSQEAMTDAPISPLREGKRIMHGSLTEVRQAKRGPGLSAKQGVRKLCMQNWT